MNNRERYQWDGISAEGWRLYLLRHQTCLQHYDETERPQRGVERDRSEEEAVQMELPVVPPRLQQGVADFGAESNGEVRRIL